jgi:Ca-activated chloride channel homolog
MRAMTPRRAGIAFGAVMLAALAAHSQVSIVTRLRAPPADAARPGVNLRVDRNMVLIPVAVSDKRDRPITGLERENFRVFDDSVEQNVTAFAEEDEPVAVGLVFDASGSMSPRLPLSRRAASAFFTAANPADEFFLVEFSDKPELRAPLARDTFQIEAELRATRARGRTALLDAVVLAMHELSRSNLARKALLIISDGGDNNSRYSASEVRDLVRESDALVYAIGIHGDDDTPEEARGPDLLSQIANQSGGRYVTAPAEEIPDVAAKISVELRNRYVLGFSPSDWRRDGRYHGVTVKVEPPPGMPPLRAAWRRGYYAPPD